MVREDVEGSTMVEVVWDSLGLVHGEWVRVVDRC